MTPVASLPTRRLRQLRLDSELGRRSLIDTARSHRRPQCTDGGRLTLEESLTSVWEGLLAVGAADCVVCGATMRRNGQAGECAGCGSRLS
jgi:hypothetical protein